MEENYNDEILTKEDFNRYTIFPIKYPKIWEAYQNAEDTYWTTQEIDLSKDKNDWTILNEDEKYFIKNILAFFAASDGIVMENLASRFLKEIQIAEARAFYSYQIHNENIHSVTYSLLIDTYISDKNEKNKLLNAIEHIECVKNKAKWAIKWIEDKSSSLGTRLIAFSIVEGIFFSGSFCAIYWLKKRGLMPGLTFSNELISRDEGLHTDFAVLMYSMVNNKIDFDIVKMMVNEAVELEKDFIINSLPCRLIGMNSELMSQYIEYVSDRLLLQLGYDKIFNVTNPFDFMELISLRPKSNFFEVRVGEYKKENINDNEDFKLVDDF